MPRLLLKHILVEVLGADTHIEVLIFDDLTARNAPPMPALIPVVAALFLLMVGDLESLLVTPLLARLDQVLLLERAVHPPLPDKIYVIEAAVHLRVPHLHDLLHVHVLVLYFLGDEAARAAAGPFALRDDAVDGPVPAEGGRQVL